MKPSNHNTTKRKKRREMGRAYSNKKKEARRLRYAQVALMGYELYRLGGYGWGARYEGRCKGREDRSCRLSLRWKVLRMRLLHKQIEEQKHAHRQNFLDHFDSEIVYRANLKSLHLDKDTIELEVFCALMAQGKPRVDRSVQRNNTSKAWLHGYLYRC